MEKVTDKTPLTVEEMRRIQLGILDQLDAFCRKNNLRYSLGGGTLLGAVRHKGCIPWDDDIDVMMPRPDYDYFVTHFNDEYGKESKCCAFENDETWKFPFAKICDCGTVLLEENVTQELGVNIDLFPIDGVPNSKKQFIKKYCFKYHFLIAYLSDYNFNAFKSLIYKSVRKFITLKTIQNSLRKFLLQNSFDKSNYAGAVVGLYQEKEIYEQKIFCSYSDYIFENKTYKGISDFDTYLSGHYGNYMELPPIEMQVRHHKTTAYRK